MNNEFLVQTAATEGKPARKRHSQIRIGAAVAGATIAVLSLMTLTNAKTARADNFSGDDSRIVYQGRTVPDVDTYSPDGTRAKFYWSGTEIHIKFSGSTTIRMNMRVTQDVDANGNLLIAGFPTDFMYILDGVPLTNSDGSLRQDAILTLGDTQTIATGLSTGTHTLVIRDNQDSTSVNWMETLVLDSGATLLQADPLPNRRIEFYGDSTTFASPLPGPAVPGPGDDPNNDTFWTASSYNAYTGQTGRNLNTDYRITGKGGIGISYGSVGTSMSAVWNHIACSPAEPLYNLTQWTPDVVVVGLGQNDSSFIGQGGSYDTAYTAWVAAYLAQVRALRAAYPNAWILCMNTTMTDPSFFAAEDGINGPFTHLQNDSEFTSDGKILVRTFPQQGFGYHPKATQHKQMADALSAWISSLTGWANSDTSASTTLITGFETTDLQPTWNDTPDQDFWTAAANPTNVSGYYTTINPECSIRTGEEAHTGSSALMYSGTANGGSATYLYYKVFDLAANPLAITSASTISYWIYPQQDNGRYVAVDFHCTDGSTLRDSGIKDSNGFSLHPNAGHGGSIPLNSWTQISASLGALAGKTVDRVWVGYDRPGSTGQYRGYIDDIDIDPPVVTLPGTPTGLSTVAANAQVAISWAAPAGTVSSYKLYRSTTAGGEGATAYKSGLTAKSYTDTGLTNGTTYYYKVAAVGGSGTGIQSLEAYGKPQATGTKINDNGSQVTYSGAWTASTDPGCYSDDLHYATANGSSVTFSFSGTSVSWIGSTGSDHGIASVSIDGGAATLVSTYASATAKQQTLFTKTGLASGSHTLKITVGNTKNSASTGYEQDIDAFQYQ